MKTLISILIALSSSSALASVTRLICIPSQNDDVQIEVLFNKAIDPKTPFIGSYNFGATLIVKEKGFAQNYTNSNIRMTPEVYYSDISMRGDAEGVYLRLYPQFKGSEFSHYTGQLFVNDLETRDYFNFRDSGAGPGFSCK
ncbi:hypothetical protein AZI85_04235 [Bdellovibrio bacteriovorus]|uniref:Uncharacterized protein n=1 Tax=Bdellovibrio bacteriovorus TaxID=959 RepID=A0A150WHR1_BDEBC|nr:hypothetical protein [Bdellovibrio bacteriovorus]KYG63251.1 hypothetical protein AZI85_04235 [Bdellovibrio bacteriovorus]